MWKNRKAIGKFVAAVAVAIIVVAVIVGIVVYNDWMWTQTHYEVKQGYVAIVTDQIGGFLRAEKGPRAWAEKASWETVINWNVQTRTEEMISPSEAQTVNYSGQDYIVTVMRPEPLGNRRYGALPFSTADGGRVSIDVRITYHFDVVSDGWQARIQTLYTNFPGVNPDTLDLIENATLGMVRGALRVYASAQNYTVEDLAYSKQAETEVNSMAYVQSYLNNVTILARSVVMDNIALGSRLPDANLQVAHQQRLVAIQEVQTTLLKADATRQATITIAEGQAIAIGLVTNATSQSIEKLLEQNVTAQEAIQYLGLQYEYDALRKIAEAHPDWKLTIFINSPTLTYTIPVNP
jgi:regulator of protease activity HflC (stomatin/prohibitin superfamily)